MSISDLIAGELLYQQSRNPYYAFSQGLAQTPTPEFENDPITAGLFGFGKNLVGGLAGAYGSSQVDKNISDFTSQILAGLTGGTPSNPRAKSAVDSIYAQQKIADALTPRDRGIEAEIAKAFIQNPQAAQQLARSGVTIDPTDPKSIVKFNKEMSQGMGAPVEIVEGIDKYRDIAPSDWEAMKAAKEDERVDYERKRELQAEYAEPVTKLSNDLKTIDRFLNAYQAQSSKKGDLIDRMGDTGSSIEGAETFLLGLNPFGSDKYEARSAVDSMKTYSKALGEMVSGKLGTQLTDKDMEILIQSGISSDNPKEVNRRLLEAIIKTKSDLEQEAKTLTKARAEGIPYQEAAMSYALDRPEQIQAPKADEAGKAPSAVVIDDQNGISRQALENMSDEEIRAIAAQAGISVGGR